MIVIIVGAILGAIGRRIAGGVIGDLFGRQPKHIVATSSFGALVGIAAYFGTWSWQFALVAGLGCWLGHILGLHGSAGMGWVTVNISDPLPRGWTFAKRLPGDTKVAVWTQTRYARDFAGMYLYGFLCLVLGGLFIELCPLGRGLRVLPLCLGAFCVPLAYTIAWLIQDHKPGRRGFNGNPLELAEWIAGAAIGIAVAAV